MIELPTLILLCALVFLAGFIDSIAGGGGIISIPAYLAAGLPVRAAYACNKFSATAGIIFSAGRFFANGALDLKIALCAAAGSFVSASVTSQLVLVLDERLLKVMLLVFLPLIAVFLLVRRDFGARENEAAPFGLKTVAIAAAIGLLIGAYDGLVGPGTGTFAIIAYTTLMKYDLKTASGNAKIMNLASNAASVITFWIAGTIQFSIAIPCAVCCVAGSFIGSGLAIRKGARFIKPMMVVVLVLLLGKLAFDVFAAGS